MIWLPVMFCDERDMFDVRMEEVSGWQASRDCRSGVRHVIVESPVTHKGIPKPLHYAERFSRKEFPYVEHVIASLPDDADPWVREHAQRDAAWPVIDRQAADEDWVLIGDLDEIPSHGLLDRLDDRDGFTRRRTLPDPCAVRMRVFIHAVDWEVPQEHLPPQCVAATVGYIRAHGGSLAAVRDGRAGYPVVDNGGMHFSWLGTPEAQAAKLRDKTCHTEILGTAEQGLIESGERYRNGKDAGGLPVVPVTVDDSWPALIRDRRVPAEWFRP